METDQIQEFPGSLKIKCHSTIPHLWALVTRRFIVLEIQLGGLFITYNFLYQLKLQYYFLVAESSRRCWEKVESIMENVRGGTPQDNHPKQITQSLFMFLEGMSEEEKYHDLECL